MAGLVASYSYSSTGTRVLSSALITTMLQQTRQIERGIHCQESVVWWFVVGSMHVRDIGVGARYHRVASDDGEKRNAREKEM